MKGLYELLSYCRPYQRTAYLRGVIGTVFPRCHTRENIELLMEVNLPSYKLLNITLISCAGKSRSTARSGFFAIGT